MIASIIAWSARNKFLVIILTAVAVGFAIDAMRRVPLDAIPDLSDTQVIVYSRWDRGPDVLEDQVTYPIVTALLGAPRVKAIRGFSDFGYSFVYIIFEDGTDLYWARSRVVEYLSKIQSSLPEGVRTEIGPDATGVGWVYQYALVDRSGRHDLASLRSFQDWYLRYWLQSVPGVAEVASIGGYQKQYQVNVDPQRLLAYKLPLDRVITAVRDGNSESGGRLVEIAGAEFMVRGRGYAKSISDLETIAVGSDATGTPILLRDVAQVTVGPALRRGIADLDGRGDTVGGIVVMRSGENALRVIARVKAKLAEVRGSLPEGVEIVPTYDRSGLIERSIATLRGELIAALIIVSLVILLFLWHIPSAIVPIITIPISVLLAFIPMSFLGVTSNIMSLAGIAISIGVLVDGAIVEVENAYKRLEQWEHGGRSGDFHAIRLAALQEVGPAVFFSLLVVAVAFLPIFTLVDQEGRLFKPLAYTKNLAMAIAAILAITLDPAVRMLFTRMDPFRFRPRWIAGIWNRIAVGTYYPKNGTRSAGCCSGVRARLSPGAAVAQDDDRLGPAARALDDSHLPSPGTGIHAAAGRGRPRLHADHPPGVSVTEMERVLQTMDALLADTPEVVRVFGKAGRAETSTDPAPLSMVETTILLRPRSEWRAGMTREKLEAELHAKLQFPGVTNAWVMPIRNRIDMLATGIRTPIGVKVFGSDLAVIEEIGASVETALRDLDGTRSVFAERTAGGYFLDLDFKREELARHGLAIREVESAVTSAIGGDVVTTTIEGRERYGVSVRYPRELRDDPEALGRVLIATPMGAQVPLGQLADIRRRTGPSMIRDENGLLAGYVFVDVTGRDLGGYVDDAKRRVAERVSLPTGYSLQWSGQYENMQRVRQRLKLVVPVTLFLIVVLLYLNTGSAMKTSIVLWRCRSPRSGPCGCWPRSITTSRSRRGWG
jgi:Cu(I)/Ag(I) efflux system membrane protein CusA/SilA